MRESVPWDIKQDRVVVGVCDSRIERPVISKLGIPRLIALPCIGHDGTSEEKRMIENQREEDYPEDGQEVRPGNCRGNASG
jgi:hypothetical protein